MAEVFSFMAEEISRAIAMVWGGVAIASELNYRLMSVIITSTTRIVQLLFLLTQKVSDVFSIIIGDILLFIGDIGMGTMAFFNLFWNFSTSVFHFIVAIITGVENSISYLLQLLASVYNTIIYFIFALQAYVCSLFIMLRDLGIMFGSSVIFIITFIPNLIHLLICEAVSAVQNLHISCRVTILQVFSDSKLAYQKALDCFVNYFSVQAVYGLALGIIIIVLLKMSFSYLTHNIRMPDIDTSSFIVNLKRTILSWCSRIWNEEHSDPVITNNVAAETMDGNDENGNDRNQNIPDRNQNIPDRNLDREQIPSVRPTNNSIYLSRRPLSRYQNRIGLRNDASDDEVTARRKSPSKKASTHAMSSSFENIADKLQKQLEEERDNQLCAVCQDKKKNIILLPCRHLCLCSYCSLSLFRREEPCPICRKVVTETLKVYL